MNPAENILSFYGWWQMSVCTFAFLGLIAIWYHLGRRQNDHGQVWLALSVLCWSFSGLIEVLDTSYGLGNSVYLDGGRSIFSLLNSLFILLSLPWFRYLPNFIEPIIKSKYWSVIVGLPFVFSMLPTISKMISGKGPGFISELDVYYSVLTLLFLGSVLWQSFAKRRLTVLAYLSVVCILITFVAQLYKMTYLEINLTLFSAIFKTCLIMIFFALALSWVKDLSDQISVIPHLIKLRLECISGKNKVELHGLNGINQKHLFTLTPANYELLQKFVKSKVVSEGWLEIKPKNDTRSGKLYDINDHNQIKRLINAMLDGIYGKENWSKEQHAIPLKNLLFQMSEKHARKIRLAIPKEQLSL